MMKRALAVLAVLSVVFLTGCFEIEQSIDLKQDLSGTADFHLGVDLEPMVVVMAQFAKEMEGKSGALTAAELAKAKADFKKNATTKKSEPPSREEIAKSLPEGVSLLSFATNEKDFGMASDFKFGFKKLSNLVGVKLPSKKGGDPTQKNVIDSPFEGLELSESSNTLTIRSKPQNPAETVQKESENAPKLDKATEKLIRDAFGKMRVVYRISAPFPVVSHNATRREGNTLVWEYDLATFEKMAKSGKIDDTQLRVTYRR